MNLKQQLDNKSELRKHLFERGFLITDKDFSDCLDAYPFYDNWKTQKVGNYTFYIYKTVKAFFQTVNSRTFFLIGHAYNPYSMEIDENVILKIIGEAYGTNEYFERMDELTGIFIIGSVSGKNIDFTLDASGMQYGCYGEVDGKQYISSHMRLIGDLCDLQTDDYVRRLVDYKWYHYMMGNYMPGELTCFKELKRIIPNTYVYFDGKYQVKRFYPYHEIEMCKNEEEYQKVIEEASMIMMNNMKLIPQKWERPAISLTGGIDSNTTFAAANGVYDQYTTFSYISMYRESVDAEKAKEISDRFNVPHKVYQIPDSNDDVPDFELYKAILEHNDGDIGSNKDSDVRKKVTLINSDVCDVEVKSWISETIRAYAYKYFGRTKFRNDLRPRDYSSLYKIFLGKRGLLKETDHYFEEYIRDTQLKEHLFNYDESDFFVWEMMHGGKCGLNIGVMKSCFDITIPYNNRKLLDLLLRVPLEKRISDQHHLDMKKYMNKELYDMNIRVVNLNETNRRKKAINAYYVVNTHLPF